MEWSSIITEIGGGLPAVVIAALGFTVWHLWKRVNDQTDRALERERQHSAELVEVIRAIDNTARALGERK